MSQSIFAAALLDPTLPVPRDLTGPDAMPVPARFAVYRNTVAVGLTEALRQGFPVVRKLVGDDFFTGVAGIFLRMHPPRSRIMMLYGADFASFLASFPPAADLPYLPDVARLEQAIRESYHAADAAPVTSEALTTLPDAQLLQSRLTLAPALRLVRSSWPIHAIWTANTTGSGTIPHQPQDVVITRPHYDPSPMPISPSDGTFIAGLLAGKTLTEAVSAAGPGLNLTALLTLLVQSNAIVGVTIPAILHSMTVQT